MPVNEAHLEWFLFFVEKKAHEFLIIFVGHKKTLALLNCGLPPM